MLNKKEKQLLLDFLEQLYDYLGNEGCNDWEFPEDWTEKEKAKFVKAFHDLNGDPEEFDKDNLNLPDFCVVALLKHKLEK